MNLQIRSVDGRTVETPEGVCKVGCRSRKEETRLKRLVRASELLEGKGKKPDQNQQFYDGEIHCKEYFFNFMNPCKDAH
jgi:hypothetical protein